jgi:hypothetical protein
MGQIVGGSGFYAAAFFPACTDPVEHAVLWENGKTLDLNSFVPQGTDLTLNEAFFINERGEISGFGTLSNGDQHAFLLIPCNDKHDGGGSCEDGAQQASVSPSSSFAPPPFGPTVRNLPGISRSQRRH